MKIDKPEYYQNELVEEVDELIKDISEMQKIERQFINGIIRQVKPKKILEVGISSGAGTAIILNAIKDMQESKLYSIDYNTKWYKDKSKLSGFIVTENFKDLTDKWKLYTGGAASKFMEIIGNDIDMCIMDTVHWNPGEFLDFLMVFPFLKKNAIFILHDIQIFIPRNNDLKSLTCPMLFSALKGKKFYIEKSDLGCGYSNIGAIILDTDYIKETIEDIFFMLTFPWGYKIQNSLHIDTIKLFNKYYDEYLVSKYEQIILYNKDIELNAIQKDIELLNTNQKIVIDKLDNKLNELDSKLNEIDYKSNGLINAIAWWIPIRKLRDNFRNKFKMREEKRREEKRREEKRISNI